jgi:formimidoylglutamate deiminase
MPESLTGKEALTVGDAREVAWLPDLIYTGGRFASGLALVCDAEGRVKQLARADEVNVRVVRLKNRALLPGLVNAHSHAFQRVIRGRTERRARAGKDNFWTWREQMYSAATRLKPEDIYDASRMAFLEMAAGGITAVGEFHYLHRTMEGREYDDPNLLAKEVLRAARDVGLRIALLRVAYARSGYLTAPNERQARFIEADAGVYLRHVERLADELKEDEKAWVGVAPHSVRAVPLAYLREVAAFAATRELPLHMHVAEQPAEIAACLEEHGRTPVVLLDAEGLLGERFTGVHAIHITDEEARMLARSRSMVCACPTTERNLGDGIIKTDLLFREGVRVSLGTDSHTQIDLLEDARELEYHLRLQRLERAVLSTDGGDATSSSLAARLFDCATLNGAESIRAPSGTLEINRAADFFTVDLNDFSIAGASVDELLAGIVFSLARTAVRDVCVGGKLIIEDGRHADEADIVQKFAVLQRRLWN